MGAYLDQIKAASPELYQKILKFGQHQADANQGGTVGDWQAQLLTNLDTSQLNAPKTIPWTYSQKAAYNNDPENAFFTGMSQVRDAPSGFTPTMVADESGSNGQSIGGYTKSLGNINGIPIDAQYDTSGNLTGYVPHGTQMNWLDANNYVTSAWDPTGKVTATPGYHQTGSGGGMLGDFTSLVGSAWSDLGPIGQLAALYVGGGALGGALGAGGAADLAGAAPDFTSAAAGYGGATAGVGATTGFDAASLAGASAPADYTGPGIGEGSAGSNVSNPVYDNTPPPETTPTDAATTPPTSGSSTANSLLKNIGTKLATNALLGGGATSGAKSGTTGSAAGTSAPTGPTFDKVPLIPTGRIIDAPKSDVLNPLLFSLAGFPMANQRTPTQDPYSDTSLGTTTASAPAPAPVPQPQPEQPQNFAQGGLASVHPAGEPEFYSEGGLHNRYIKGDGDGTSDSIPAMVADSEFVMPADVVAALGNGSSDAGAHKLDMMVQQIRKRARSSAPSELPPTAHESPLDYLKGRA